MVGTPSETEEHTYKTFRSVIALFSVRSIIIPLILQGLLFLPGPVFSQVKNIEFFKERISFIYNSPYGKTDDKLRKLLLIQRQMKMQRADRDSAFMYLLQKIGVLYYAKGDFVSAVNCTKSSILLANECLCTYSCNALPLVHNYSNLFYYYERLHDLRKAFDTVDSCLIYALEGGEGFNELVALLLKKAEYLFNQGEYNLCSKYSKLGEDIIEKYYHGNHEDNIKYIVSFVINQVTALYFANDVSVEKKLQQKIRQLKETGNYKFLGSYYSLMGLIKRDKKEYNTALEYFRKSNEVNLSSKFDKQYAQNFGFIATLYKEINKFDSALIYCAKALKCADFEDSLFILREKGNIYVLKKMYDTAQYYFQKAFNTVQNGIDETSILQKSFHTPGGFNQLQKLLDLTTDKGNSFLQQYYREQNDSCIKKAILVYKKADLFLTKIKIEQHLEFASNLIWRNTARELYEHAIEACYVSKNINDAFYFFEKGRAILLNDEINEQKWMADSDLIKQAYLKKAISELEKHLVKIHIPSKEYLAVQKKLFTYYFQFDTLTNAIKNKNQLPLQHLYSTDFISLPGLRKSILKNSRQLIEIFSGNSAVYVLNITPENQTLQKNNKQVYDSLSSLFNYFITNHNQLNSHFRDFVKSAHQLYNLLFQNIPAYNSIIISPDGLSFPFEALVMNTDYQQPDYFLNHYATSYTYSARYLTNEFAADVKTANNVFGVAPVKYKYSNLAELFGSDTSLENINKYFINSTNYIFERATKNNFQQNFPDYKIVQLYTHGSDSSDNNEPVIYFADSALYLSQLILNRKPVTQLVVLSACETAKGKLYPGEGIFSFNRGFAALGIPAAISNLWSVENASSYRIIESFYKYISEGLPTDVALQKSKKEFINSNSSQDHKLPYFWASSILTGKVGTIEINKSDAPFTKLLLGLILGLGVVYYITIVRLKNTKG